MTSLERGYRIEAWDLPTGSPRQTARAEWRASYNGLTIDRGHAKDLQEATAAAWVAVTIHGGGSIRSLERALQKRWATS